MNRRSHNPIKMASEQVQKALTTPTLSFRFRNGLNLSLRYCYRRRDFVVCAMLRHRPKEGEPDGEKIFHGRHICGLDIVLGILVEPINPEDPDAGLTVTFPPSGNRSAIRIVLDTPGKVVCVRTDFKPFKPCKQFERRGRRPCVIWIVPTSILVLLAGMIVTFLYDHFLS